MAIAFVRQATASFTGASGTSLAVTITAPTAGNALVLTLTGNAFPRISSISGGGVTWAVLKASDFNNWNAEVWYGLDSSGSGTTVTITMGATGNAAVNVSEWSGIKTASAADTTNTNSATGTAVTTGSVTPSAAPALVIGVTAHNDTASPSAGPDGGFTALTQVIGSSMVNNSAYLIQTSAAAANPGWTLAGSVTWEATAGVLLGVAVAISDPYGMSGFFGV
jgi:hypothetical protein